MAARMVVLVVAMLACLTPARAGSLNDLLFAILFSAQGVQFAPGPGVLAVEEIRRTEESLARAGFDPGTIDGRWATETAVAMRRFQHARGLRTTGTLDGPTRAALQLAYAAADGPPVPAGPQAATPPTAGSGN